MSSKKFTGPKKNPGPLPHGNKPPSTTYSTPNKPRTGSKTPPPPTMQPDRVSYTVYTPLYTIPHHTLWPREWRPAPGQGGSTPYIYMNLPQCSTTVTIHPTTFG